MQQSTFTSVQFNIRYQNQNENFTQKKWKDSGKPNEKAVCQLFHSGFLVTGQQIIFPILWIEDWKVSLIWPISLGKIFT